MRIVQVMPTIAMGDAVSNDAVAIKNIVHEMGFETQIYAENIDPKLPKKTAVSFESIGRLDEKDIVLYHGSVGTDLSCRLLELDCHLMMRYHNITPPHFFYPYNQSAYELSKKGLDQMRMLASKVEYVLAVSEFNKQDLREMGYWCPMDVLPVVIPILDYEKIPAGGIIKKYDDEYVNILFVGRIVPNKKQEDLIKVFYYYKKYINPKSRLFLVGNYEGMETYKNRLDQYIRQMGVEDVIFSGHIRFEEILAYYRVADLFLCMSEHEGFCVPLVEAMIFNLPLVAYDSCAVGDTMAGGGVLVDSKDPIEISLLIEKILSDEGLKNQICDIQKKVLKKYSYDSISRTFQQLLQHFIERENGV